MKAAVMTGFGDPSVLHTTDRPVPSPKKDELLIRIEAAGLNRLDHYIREGSVNPALNFPHILGSDASGVVAGVGESVSEFSVGERIIPMPGYPTDPTDEGVPVLSLSQSYAIRGLIEDGTYAEYMTVPARWVLKDDTGLSALDVATLPMPLITAVRAVKEVGNVQPGDKVLVHAGASGTGSMMIQVAKALGAEVVTTIRTQAKADFVTGLGADSVIDMRDQDYVSHVQAWSGGGVDVVIDNLGGPNLAQSLEALRPLGTVVLMGNVLGLEASIPVRSVFFPQKIIRGSLMGGIEDLQWGLDQVKSGFIRPTLDQAFTLDDAQAAHQRLADGKALGNIVFDVR